MKGVLLALSVFLLWCSPSKADEHDECLGKCDKEYDCNPFFGICEKCLVTSSSLKCKEYFDSVKEQTQAPDDEPTSSHKTLTEPKANKVSDHQDTIPPDPETRKRDKGRTQPNRDIIPDIGGAKLQPKSNREEQHTNIIIVFATVFIITLAVGVVVKTSRGNRSPTGRGTSTSSAPDNVEAQSDQGLLGCNGAGGDTAVCVEETAL